MAITGGGSAGNPTGGTAGVGKGLNYIGTDPVYAFAYSGGVTVAVATSATTTMLNFKTGNSFIVGTFSFTGQNTGSNDEFLSITLNDQAVCRGRYPSASARITEEPVDLLIPPYTQVTVKLGVETTAQEMTFVFMGRVYE